jgi:hypothetical protein
MTRLSEVQSLFSVEVEKVRQQLGEAKESADNATDISLATRAVAEEAQKNVGEVRSEVETHRNAFMEVRALAEGAQTKAASTEAQLGIVVSALIVVSVLPPSGWSSAIVPDFPKLFEDFNKKRFTLLWRGSRDGFGATDFHGRCDGHPNTLTVIADMKGNIFGGFTPVKWKDWGRFKADPSLKSFLFTLKNPHNVPARRFPLKAQNRNEAIYCDSDCGPSFYDIAVSDNCNTNTQNTTSCFGRGYTNDTELDRKTFFTGSEQFVVQEIEVFEITD